MIDPALLFEVSQRIEEALLSQVQFIALPTMVSSGFDLQHCLEAEAKACHCFVHVFISAYSHEPR